MKNLSYNKALKTLQEIKAKIQDEETSIDELSDLARQAKELIQICKIKLREAEEKVNEIIQDDSD